MKGENAVFSPFNQDGNVLEVNELFYTLQGEGPDAGLPAIFLRLARCNLRCGFCDQFFDHGRDESTEHLAKRIIAMSKANTCKLVVITGGEPFLQNFVPLILDLQEKDIRVSVETAGTLWLPDAWQIFYPTSAHKIICSPKTPKLNEQLITRVSVWKYIVACGEVDPVDGLPNRSTQLPGEPSIIYRPDHNSKVPIYLQPRDDDDAELNAENRKFAAALCMKHGYRLSLQLHKYCDLP